MRSLLHDGVKPSFVVVTRFLPRDGGGGGIAEDHEAPEAEQLPRACLDQRSLRDNESPKSKWREESIAGQCRMS